MNDGYASHRWHPGPGRSGPVRGGGYRSAPPRRNRGPWAVVTFAVVVAVASGCVVVKEAVHPGPPASLPVGPGADSPPAPPPVSLGAVSWPVVGVSAADISGIGVVAGPGADRMVPIASVAKVMTAYVIMHDHPLGAGEPGPGIVVQPQDAAAYPAQVGDGDSVVPVTAGERISERQALAALLLPSADNMAWILARWDAGSETASVARMNATARRLGLTSTRYTDPSGLAGTTASTAADQVRLGMATVSQPAFAAIVAMRRAIIPVAGVVRNYDTLLGKDGIAGVKTGNTPAAGGCVLLAARQQVGRHRVLIVAAVFGQPGTMRTMLSAALKAGDHLMLALDSALAPAPPRTSLTSARPRPHKNKEDSAR
jgi:serine-type D-Ala-D-Ala carboxypeptidase (penicillin-binding protein 5/6)